MIDRRAFFRNRIPQYRKNIALFAGEVLQFTPDDWQRTVFRSIEQNRYTAVKSGQGVGKTGTEAVVVLWFLCRSAYLYHRSWENFRADSAAVDPCEAGPRHQWLCTVVESLQSYIVFWLAENLGQPEDAAKI